MCATCASEEDEQARWPHVGGVYEVMGDLYVEMRAVPTLGVEVKKEEEVVLEDRWTE